MANQRSKDKRQANVSFTLAELQAVDDCQRSMKIENRSDFIRQVLNEWMAQRERLIKRAAQNQNQDQGKDQKDISVD